MEEDALLVSMVTIMLVQHQSCKQQLLRMSPCGEEDREEENRREGNRAIEGSLQLASMTLAFGMSQSTLIVATTLGYVLPPLG